MTKASIVKVILAFFDEQNKSFQLLSYVVAIDFHADIASQPGYCQRGSCER